MIKHIDTFITFNLSENKSNKCIAVKNYKGRITKGYEYVILEEDNDYWYIYEDDIYQRIEIPKSSGVFNI